MLTYLTLYSLKLNMGKIINITVIYLSLFIQLTYSAEIDSYKYMDHIKDSSSLLNSRINSWLNLAISELNDNMIECPTNPDEAQDVYEIVQSYMATPFIGHTIAVDLDEDLSHNMISRTPFHHSIYSDVNWLEGVSLNLKGLLGVMKIGNKRVGVDKLGHFFVEGFGFYKRAYIRNNASIEKAIEWGKFTERTYFGLTTTGIYSNADLVANFNGMRFWNMLFLFDKDPLEQTIRSSYFRKPFFTCIDSKWHLNKRFSIRHFVDDSWDESLNCNNYDTETIKEEVILKEALSLGVYQVEKQNGLVCPRVTKDCEYEINKYGQYAKDLLHKYCFDESEQYKIDTSILRLRLPFLGF